MFNNVKPEVLRSLDPKLHQKEILEIYKSLAQLNSQSIEHYGMVVTKGTTPTTLGYQYEHRGIPFVRSQNVLSNELSGDLLFISEECDRQMRRSQVKRGDVLTNIVGASIGRTAVYNLAERGNTNQAVAIVKDNGSIDMHYLSTWMNSSISLKLMAAQQSGNARDNFDLCQVRETEIPRIRGLAQKYIGDKVRQAERLRAWAKGLVAECDLNISENFEYKLVDSMRLHPRWMTSKLISEISLGPEFARGSEGQLTFKGAVPLSEIIDSCKCGDAIKSEDRVEGKYPYYGASGPIDLHNEYNFEGTSLIIAQDGSIGFASVARGKIWANNHVWVVKVKDNYDIDVVARYLDVHFPYWKGITTGSVVPKVTSENLLSLKIPLAVAKDKESGDLLRKSNNAKHASTQLVKIAKHLIEALIEGQLTEQQLITAQQALEVGDNSQDYDILSRLTNKGFDAEGEPLFPDLDQLYDLLAQSQQAREG